MRFNETYPDYAAIEEHIRRARIERSVVVSEMIVAGVQALGRAFKALRESLQRNFYQELDRRFVEADAFLKRSVPRY